MTSFWVDKTSVTAIALAEPVAPERRTGMPRKILERLLWHFLNYGFFFLYLFFAVAGLCAAWIGWVRCDMKLAEQALKATHPFLLLCTVFVGIGVFAAVGTVVDWLVRWGWKRYRQ